MNIPGMKLYQRGTPILLLLNLIDETAQTMPPLARIRCMQLLEAARSAGLPVAHAIHHAQAANENAGYSVDESETALRPKSGEMLVTRRTHSCFSNDPFARLIEACNEPHLIIAGNGINDAGLATCIDAVERGVKTWFVADASHSNRRDVNIAMVRGVMGQFARIVTASEVVSAYPVTEAEDLPFAD